MKKYLLSAVLAMIWVAAATAQIPTNGLIEQFTFDNTLTGSAGTVLGTNNQANYVADRFGAASSAQNISNSDYAFNNVNMPNLPAGNADRTVCFWYKSNSNNTHSLFNYGNSSTNNFAIAYTTGPDRLIMASGAIEHNRNITYTGNWTHVAVVSSGGGSSMYVNGVLQGTSSTMTYTTTSNPIVRIGYSPGGQPYSGFQMDDLLIYNRALTPQEISGIYSVCASPVNTTPSANLSVCNGNTTTLTASGPPTLSWYGVPTGGSVLGTGSSFTTPALTADATYYVQSTAPGACTTRVAIPVAVVANNMPVPTNTTNIYLLTRCDGETTTLSVSSSGAGTVNWYNVPLGGTSLGTGNTFTTPALAGGTPSAVNIVTYYAEEATSCGNSSRVAIPITIKHRYTLTNTTPFANKVVCVGSSTTLSVSTNAPTIEWTEFMGSGTVLSTSATFTTPALSNILIYNVEAKGDPATTCAWNEVIPVRTATASSTPPTDVTPVDSITNICAGKKVTLQISSNNGGVLLYDAPTGGNAVASPYSSMLNTQYLETPIITANTTYYAQTGIGACASPRTPINITVTGGTGVITLSNDTIKASNLFDTYVLKRDGAVVSSGNTGSFAVHATACGTYQAEFTNTINNCSNMGVTITRQVAPCGTYLSLSNIQFPVTYNYAFGTPAGAPSIVQNQNPINIPICTNVLLNVNIRGANGCMYSISFQTASLTNGPVTLSRPSTSDTVTNCIIYSNTITIAPQGPVNTTASSLLTVCNGSSTTLSASGNGTLEWYDVAIGGAALGTGTTFNTPAITANGTFYVQSVSAGCASVRTPIAVAVAAPPATPVSNTPSANLAICSGNSTVLSVVPPSSGISTFWSTLPQGGSSFATGNSVTIPASSLTVTDTFYVGHVFVSNNCSSPLIPIIVTVTNTPAAPVNTSGANQSICPGTTTTLSVTGSGILGWYDAGTGGALLGTGNSFTTPVLASSTTYYVNAASNGCSSAHTQIAVTVNPAPPAPTNTTTAANLTLCSGSTATLTATSGYAGSQVRWYDVATGGTPLTTGGVYVTPVITATDTFYVAAETALCPSPRTRIIVTVNANPNAAINTATPSICQGESVTLTASGGGTYAWSNSGGNNANATFTPTSNSTYTVTVTNAANCTATASTSITVRTSPVAAIAPTSAAICNGESQILTASGGTSYTWSNGLGSGDTKTVSPTQTTTYTVIVTNANNCADTASVAVTVNPIPVAAINGPTTICAGLPATLTATGGNGYSWSNGLGTGASVTVSPTQSTTYTVTVTGTGNCTATATQTVSVQSAPTATISGSTTICLGESTTLTANGGNSYTWGGGLGTNAAVTVSPTSTTSYSVTVSIGANCTASATQTVTVNQPTGSTLNETLCFGGSIAFGGNTIATAGVYRDTLVNAAGCDSVVTLNLTISPRIETIINETICNGQTYNFNGQQLTQDGQYLDLQVASSGCDSFIVLNLTVVSQLTETVNATTCQGDLYSFDGQQLTVAGTYTATFTSIGGCDSVVTLNLSVLPQAQQTVAASICDGEMYHFHGRQLTQAGQYLDTLQTTAGCDSIVTLDLTVNALPEPVVSAANNELSTQAFDTYQWQLDGNNIAGATNQDHTAIQNGNYTVVVSDANGCESTSAPVTVTGVGINNVTGTEAKLYPNPLANILNIELSGYSNTSTVTITNAAGALVKEAIIQGSIASLDLSDIAAGLLHVQITNSQATIHYKVIKLD